MDMISGTGICNLTAWADRLRMGERPDAPKALTHDGMSAEILAPLEGAPFESGPVERDTLYVVTAGSGVVECNGEEVDFTAGDVLFAPAGADRHFGKLSRRFKAWKISLRPK